MNSSSKRLLSLSLFCAEFCVDSRKGTRKNAREKKNEKETTRFGSGREWTAQIPAASLIHGRHAFNFFNFGLD